MHLMVTEPIRYVEDFAKAGADILTVHVEACENLVETVDKIHACGMKAGVSIKAEIHRYLHWNRYWIKRRCF